MLDATSIDEDAVVVKDDRADKMLSTRALGKVFSTLFRRLNQSAPRAIAATKSQPAEDQEEDEEEDEELAATETTPAEDEDDGNHQAVAATEALPTEEDQEEDEEDLAPTETPPVEDDADGNHTVLLPKALQPTTMPPPATQDEELITDDRSRVSPSDWRLLDALNSRNEEARLASSTTTKQLMIMANDDEAPLPRRLAEIALRRVERRQMIDDRIKNATAGGELLEITVRHRSGMDGRQVCLAFQTLERLRRQRLVTPLQQAILEHQLGEHLQAYAPSHPLGGHATAWLLWSFVNLRLRAPPRETARPRARCLARAPRRHSRNKRRRRRRARLLPWR